MKTFRISWSCQSIDFKLIVISITKLIVITGLCTACSNQTVREKLDDIQYSARPRSAAYAAENFYLDNRSPEPTGAPKWEFYFKHCMLEGRNPVPPKAEYNCTDPY